MKRLFLFAVTAMAAIACNKSELETQNPNAPFEGTPMSITVEMPSSTDTKVDFDQTADTWITKWKEGDKLTALHYSTDTGISNDNTEFALSKVSEDGKSATFDGEYDESQDGMVLVYSGASAGNLLSGQAGLTLMNQSIKMSTTDEMDAVIPNAAGALGEYSYMISEQVDLKNVPTDYNSVSIKHLTALMELELQLTNLPEGITFSVSEVQIGISQEDYDELQADFDAGEFEGILTEMPTFATLYNEEYYDITKGFREDGFSTASKDMGVYNLAVEGLEVSSDDDTFTIPFNAFPFTVKQGEYFDITVVLAQEDKENNTLFLPALNFSFSNDTDSDLEFPRGKHHTIGYSYECEASDFDYVWDGESFESVADAEAVLGDAVEDVYEIGTAVQLAAMSYLVNNANSTYGSASYTLVAPLDLNSKEWTPIGNSNNPFSGTFDGGGLTVNGLYINQPGTDNQGLFGYIKGAIIKNLSVAGSVTGASCVGGVVGDSSSSSVTNCYNTAVVTGTDDYIGGVVGYSYKSSVTNCYNAAVVTGTDNCVGGVVGVSDNSSVTNCYNAAAVTGEGEGGGGVVGVSDNSSVTNCYNAAAVTGYFNIGGVVGESSAGWMTNCYNTGAVTGTTNVGRVLGFSYSSSVTNCYWMTDITDSASGGVGSYYGTEPNNIVGKESDELKALAPTLNSNAVTYNSENTEAEQACAWVAVSNDYPTLKFGEKPTVVD